MVDSKPEDRALFMDTTVTRLCILILDFILYVVCRCQHIVYYITEITRLAAAS